MGNSIEEDIKNINKGLYELADSYELYHASWAKRIFESIKEKLNHILSDYKRVLKENEQLRTEVNSLKKDMSKKKELDILTKEDIKILKSRTYYEPNDCLAITYKENGKNISMKRVDKAIERLLKQIKRRK